VETDPRLLGYFHFPWVLPIGGEGTKSAMGPSSPFPGCPLAIRTHCLVYFYFYCNIKKLKINFLNFDDKVMCVHISFVENKRFAVENNPIFSPIFFSSKIAKIHYINSFTTSHTKVYNDKFYDLLKIKKPCQVNSNMGMEITILQIAHDVSHFKEQPLVQ
jgi:hypothetical protein